MNSNELPPGFSRISERARRLLNDHNGVKRIVDQASAKAGKQQKRLRDTRDDLTVLFRMLRAWANRSYTTIPLRSITMALAAVLYFLLPLDFIPDFILGTGFLDDMAVIGFVLQSIRKDITLFQQWEGVDDEISSANDSLES